MRRLRVHLRRAVSAGPRRDLLLTGIAYRYVSRDVAAQERLLFEEIVDATQQAVDSPSSPRHR